MEITLFVVMADESVYFLSVKSIVGSTLKAYKPCWLCHTDAPVSGHFLFHLQP